jgi:glycosyltransferase involved in cell wall biosynthesis
MNSSCEPLSSPAGDAKELAAKIAGLWNDPERRKRLGEENHQRARQYSINAFVLRAQSYYYKLVGQCPSASWQVMGAGLA